MPKKSLRLLAVVLVAAVSTTLIPASAQAGGAETLRRCLASVEGAADQERARSMCLWKHYDYMASYGP